MTAFDALLQHLAWSPRWLVALAAIVVAGVLVWLLAKALKWAIYLTALAAFACIVVGVVAWCLT